MIARVSLRVSMSSIILKNYKASGEQAW